jgi:hypothetical protein
VTTDEITYLRVYIAQLIEFWTALSIIRRDRSGKLVAIFRDLCSDKIRNMLHELANKKKHTLGFGPEGSDKYKRLFERLVETNKWFAGYKNRLHYRNCAGSHLMPLNKADHMFQQFGYGGDIEWKRLTKGVAASLSMMKQIEGKRNDEFWRQIRMKVRGTVTEDDTSMPVAVQALLQSYMVD